MGLEGEGSGGRGGGKWGENCKKALRNIQRHDKFVALKFNLKNLNTERNLTPF